MRNIATSIEIQAPPATIWRILIDFRDYPAWNPFIRSIEGEARAGARLRIRIEPPGRSRMTFRPRVLAAEPERELRWLGHLLIPGLFDGEHSLRLEAQAPAACILHHTERFSGLLVPLFGLGMLDATRQGFEAMNAALKRRAEAAAAGEG